MYEKYIVIGIKYRTGKPFKLMYEATPLGFMTAMGINLWNGRVWGVKKDGRRKLLKRVTN